MREHRWTLRSVLSVAGLVLLAFTTAAFGQAYPLLEELNRQTQSLYREVQGGLVRVQLPTPRWVREEAAREDPLQKWDNVMDPAVRMRLEQHRAATLEGKAPRLQLSISPTTQPASGKSARRMPEKQQPSDASNVGGSWRVVRSDSDQIVLQPRPDSTSAIVIHSGGEVGQHGEIAVGGPLRLTTQPIGNAFAPNNIGLLLDDVGHVLIPIYIERETMGEGPVRVMIGDVETTARFVGSDQKTQLTILKLDRAVGRPLRLAAGRPEDGALVMMLNPASGSGRLALWTGGEKDYGVVVTMDGAVAGIARFGQLLGGAACRPVIDQLIKVGSVQRAILGVRLTEVRPEDPAVQKTPALAGRAALVVDDVSPGSLAERAGLRRGDFILEMEGEAVGDLTTWAGLSARGGDARLLIVREGHRRELKMNLQPAQ